MRDTGSWMSKLARLVWAAPASLLGVALSPFFSRRYVTRGVLVCEGAEWPRKLGWRYRAITLGHVVLAVDELDGVVMEEEFAHVRQYERWGPVFFVAYASSSLWALIRGRDPYDDNVFEKEAKVEARHRVGR